MTHVREAAFDRDGPAAAVGPAAGANAELTHHDDAAIEREMVWHGAGKSVAPRVRVVPLAPPARVVPPRPCTEEVVPGTRAKASPAPQTRSTSSRRGSGAFNQACVLLFFHRKAK